MARTKRTIASKNVAPRMSLHARIRRNAPAPAPAPAPAGEEAGEEAVEPEAQGE